MDKDDRGRQSEKANYLGPRELLRFIVFFVGWIFIGLVLSLILGIVFGVEENIYIGLYLVFVITAVFVFPISARFLKPANRLMNKVFGNEIVTMVSPSRSILKVKYPWYYFLPSVWRMVLLLILLFLGIRLLMK